VSSRLVNRNVTANRGRTSMRLEPELWDALQEICDRERVSIGEIVRRIEKHGHPGGRTSAVRVHVLGYFRSAATEAGHRLADHGDAPIETGGAANGRGEAQSAPASGRSAVASGPL
jgi:predicted DNA-binding ribbon-helix-helix protein